MKARALAAAFAAIVLLTATGCSNDDDTKGLGDAPVATMTSGQRGGDDTPATVTNMPDYFGNVATKCVAGAKPWRLIEGTNTDYTGSNFALVQDPEGCGGDWVARRPLHPLDQRQGRRVTGRRFVKSRVLT